MPADVAPLVADGGNIRLVRRVAAYAYGSRDVTWPEGAEDPKEELPDGREFGWVAQLDGPTPGLSGRRFVRADAVIDAVEGVSNTEQLLDDAAERTGGDVHFETLISGRGLAGQEPGIDFQLGDRVPARFWGRLLPGQLVTEVGWDESGPYAKLGGQMLRDLDALARTRAELTRTIRREREETAGAVASARLYADSAVSVERSERVSDVDSVRVVLGGARADEESLVSQLAAVQAQITGMVGVGETPPAPGLLNSYLWMNTRLWQQQKDINLLQEYLTTINKAATAHAFPKAVKAWGVATLVGGKCTDCDVEIYGPERHFTGKLNVFPGSVQLIYNQRNFGLRGVGRIEFKQGSVAHSETVFVSSEQKQLNETFKDELGNIVFRMGTPYQCLEFHTSSSFRDMLATLDGDWSVTVESTVFANEKYAPYRYAMMDISETYRKKGLAITDWVWSDVL